MYIFWIWTLFGLILTSWTKQKKSN